MRPFHVRAGLTRQRGAALMVMLVIMIVGGAAFLVSALSSSSLKTVRQETTSAALAQAKEALIGYAIKDVTRPGELPCPDVDGDGKLTMGADYSSGATPVCTSFIGYLPWFTLGLSELRGGDNDKLWYALSPDFYAGNTVALNSDTQGQLSIVGNMALSNVAAILFAPGTPLCGKSHGSNSVTDYLEAGDGTTTSYDLKSFSDECDNPSNSPYNDNLLAITSSQLFQFVEKRVAKEIEIGIKPVLNTYYNLWGAFPFASPFADPSISSFAGQAAIHEGLLPVGNLITTTTLQWQTLPAPRFYVDGVDEGACSFSTGSVLLRCGNNTLPYTSVPEGKTITFTGVLKDVGFGLWQPHDVTNTAQVSVRRSDSTYVRADTMLDNPTITANLNTDGSANITFKGIGKVGGTILRRVQLSRNISQSSITPAWILPNNWHRLMYYAISQGYAPGGGDDCEPLGTSPHVKPYCLTTSGGNSQHALIISTGGPLSGQTHPSGTLSNYLEDENATPAPPTPSDFTYEAKTRSDTFNDQIIIVAP